MLCLKIILVLIWFVDLGDLCVWLLNLIFSVNHTNIFLNITEYCNAKCINNYSKHNQNYITQLTHWYYFNQLYMVSLSNSLYMELSREGDNKIYFK